MYVESWFNPNVNCEVLMIYQNLIQFPYILNVKVKGVKPSFPSGLIQLSYLLNV